MPDLGRGFERFVSILEPARSFEPRALRASGRVLRMWPAEMHVWPCARVGTCSEHLRLAASSSEASAVPAPATAVMAVVGYCIFNEEFLCGGKGRVIQFSGSLPRAIAKTQNEGVKACLCCTDRISGLF